MGELNSGSLEVENRILEVRKYLNERTPLEVYNIKGVPVCVKRDDLFMDSCKLAKMRGVSEIIFELFRKGVKDIGIFETKCSTAGVGVAEMCKILGINSYVFHKDAEFFYDQDVKAKEFGAEIIKCEGTMISIAWHQANKQMKEREGVMLRKGLKYFETAENVFLEAKRVDRHFDNILVTGGSFTIASGVISGLKGRGNHFWVVSVGKMGDKDYLFDNIIELNKKHKILQFGELNRLKSHVHFIQSPYDYYDKCEVSVPFNSNKNYDAKSWEWLVNNISQFEGKSNLFWNIGGNI